MNTNGKTSTRIEQTSCIDQRTNRRELPLKQINAFQNVVMLDPYDVPFVVTFALAPDRFRNAWRYSSLKYFISVVKRQELRT